MKFKKVLLIIGVLIGLSLIALGSYYLSFSSSNGTDHYVYVSDEILTSNTNPVVKEEEKTEIIKIIRPYNEEGITIAKNFYDHNLDTKDQENAIIYYKDTYLQNTGIDYRRAEVFTVLVVLKGTVISITEDEITGKTVKVKHENDMISVYQSLGDVSVKVDDVIEQGATIGTSGNNDINKELGNHLHFELLIKNKLVNPENYFDKALGEL